MSESTLKYYERHQKLIENVIGTSIDEALSTQPENPIVTIAAALLKRCKVESAADATLLRSATNLFELSTEEPHVSNKTTFPNRCWCHNEVN